VALSTALQNSPCYPFNLDGPLCPLLNNAEVLAEFYAGDALRHGIKKFCKKTAWPGKPAVPIAVSPEKLQELMLNLFNSPAARAILQRESEADRAVYLDNAIWQWFGTIHPKLGERVGSCCQEIDERVFIKPEPLQKLLVALQQEKPDANVTTAFAYVVLAFAMLQPDDRFRLGEMFLSAFPEYTERFCGLA